MQISSIQDKARSHNERVFQKVESHNKIMESESSIKKGELEERLQKAAALRDNRMEEIKQKSAMLAKPKGAAESPQKSSDKL